jgi:GT2 family glycosyltransferase
MTAFDVRAVIVNYNGAHMLRDCVESLQAQTGARVEVLIVDNGSTDDSAAEAARLGVRFRTLGANRGLAVGYNEGARDAGTPHLFFVNNDMRFDSSCVARLRAVFRDRKDLFAADPRHYSWEGDRITHGAQRLARDPRSSFPGLAGVRPYEDYDVATPTEIPWGCAGALFVDRNKFVELGGFDRTFFLYWEDFDLCLRAWTRGWATLHIPKAVLYHHVSASHGPKAKNSRALRWWWNRVRIGLSVPRNVQRTALKLLSRRELALVSRQTVRGAAAAVASGRVWTPIMVGLALAANALDVLEILRERRRNQRTALTTVAVLTERFASPAARP